MGKRVLFLFCLCLLAAVAAAQDLYEVLGVKASASPAQMKKACVSIIYFSFGAKVHYYMRLTFSCPCAEQLPQAVAQVPPGQANGGNA